MQVSLDPSDGLEKHMQVEVPAARVDDAVEQKLKKVGQNAKVPGFRPGKAPLKVLRQRYGEQARQEVMSELLQSTYPEALDQVEIVPAGRPRIEIKEGTSGKDMAYTAIIDTYPEIELKGLGDATLEQPVAEVTDQDVDKTLERMREQGKSFEPVERAAQKDDKATIDFTGTIDGEEFQGNRGREAEVEIGSGRFLEAMESGLEGHAAGETFSVDVTFPDDYDAEELQGKQAVFEITIKELTEPTLPEIDEEFIRNAGVEEGTLEAFQAWVRESLERELAKASRDRLKKQVMDELINANPIELPGSLVTEEIDRMRHEAVHRMAGQHLEEEKARQMLPGELFEEGARRRVHLGLLMQEAIADRGIELEQDRVEEKLDELASQYGQSDEIKQYYRSNQEVMQGIEAMVMEDQLVDLLAEEATIREVDSSLDELMESDQD